MRSLGVALVAALLAGCSLLPPSAEIQLMIPARQDVRALPVTVVDNAGVVREATPAEIPIPVEFSGQMTVRAVASRASDPVEGLWRLGRCRLAGPIVDVAAVTAGRLLSVCDPGTRD